MSIKFLSAILGPEMAAPILWTPGKMRPFCRKNHVHKIPRFRGGGILGWGGGGKCRFYFYGRGDFSDKHRAISRGRVKIAAASAENRAILVHSGQ